MSALNKAVGRKIREARKAAGMTQEDLAAITGYSRTNIGHIERGAVTARIDFIDAVANVTRQKIVLELGEYV